MKWNDIISFMKNGKQWVDIKQAQEFFESQEDIDAFLASGWSINDLREAKEMVETNPIAQKVESNHVNTVTETLKSSELKHIETPGEIFTKIAKGE